MTRINWTWPILGGVVYAVIWHLTEQGVEWLFATSQARAAYGTISAWWCVLFLSYVLALNWRASLSAIVVFFGLEWIFQPPKSMISDFSLDFAPTYILLIVGMALFFLSPMIIGSLVRFIRARLLQRSGVEA